MKAVISKNQFDRIRNFINETREIPKSKVLKEYETKQGSEDFPFDIGFDFISQNGGKDFLMRKGISDGQSLKRAILNKTITKSDMSQFTNFDGESIFDTYFGKKLPMTEKKYTPAQIKAFDKDKNGIPFQDKDWKMMDEDYNRSDLDNTFNEIVENKPDRIELSGYFPRIAGFRSSLFEKLNNVLQVIFKSNNNESYDKYLKNIILQEMVLGDMINPNTPKSYRISISKDVGYEDYFAKAKRIYGEDKIERILNIIEKNITEMEKFTNGKLNEKKKHSQETLDTFDFDNDGKPFEPRDLAALRASKKLSKELDEGSDCGCGDSDEDNDTRYMFFSNLEQMMRQAKMLLQMDEDAIEDLLNNGHDWAADHIAEAKNNMDQVFDFIMNEMNGEGEDDSWDNEEEEDDDEEREMVYEGMRLKKKAFVSKELKHHLDNKISLHESEFKYGSEKHIELLKEVKELYNKGLIALNETDEFIVTEFDPKPVKIKGIGEVYLGLIQEEYESDEKLLSEAVYQGRKVELGKPKRGELSGKKKFYVFVRNPQTGKVKKITFGQKGVKIKKNNPARRKSFRARHKCSQQKNKLSAAYWSCRAW